MVPTVFRRGLAPLVAAAVAILAVPPPAPAQQLVPVHVGAAPVDDATPVLYAIHAGLFKRVGLDVDISALGSGSAVAAAVAGGSMQFGNSSMPALISGHAHGVPFQLVAADGIYLTKKPYALMLVRKDSTIKSARDLDGKTVSSPSLKDLIWTAQASWIEKNGGDWKTVHAVEIPNSAVVTAIEEGRVDASTVLQPRLSQALDSGKVRVLGKSFDGIGTRFLISAWFTSGSYAAAHPDVVAKFTKVVEEASAYCNAHQAETVPLLAAYGHVEPKVLEHSTREEFATTLQAGDIQPQIDAAAKYGVIPKRFEAQEMIGPAKR